ncbi:MAG: response regulator [Planctomycetota bacterium]
MSDGTPLGPGFDFRKAVRRVTLLGMSVLIADNDRAVSGLLTEVLLQSGLRASHAYDGDDARRQAREPGLRVLVCDLDMPGASGLEVLESLRDLAAPPQVIVISGYLDQRIEAQLRTMPFVREVLRKPFDLLAFAANVRRLAAAGRQAAGGDGSGAAADGAGRTQAGPAGSRPGSGPARSGPADGGHLDRGHADGDSGGSGDASNGRACEL